MLCVRRVLLDLDGEKAAVENEQPSQHDNEGRGSGTAISHREATQQAVPTDLLRSMMASPWETGSQEGREGQTSVVRSVSSRSTTGSSAALQTETVCCFRSYHIARGERSCGAHTHCSRGPWNQRERERESEREREIERESFGGERH